MAYEYQTAMETLLRDIPDHDDTTAVYHELVEAAIRLDLVIQSSLEISERLITYTNMFVRDMKSERNEGLVHAGTLMYGNDLVRDLYCRHSKYVERKSSLSTLIKLLLGDSNHKKFIDLVKNS